MFSPRSFYNKDRWLNRNIYYKALLTHAPLFVKLCLKHYGQVEEYALNHKIKPEEVWDFSVNVIAQFTLDQATGKHVFISTEKDRNYVYKIARTEVFDYYSNQKKQNQKIEATEDFPEKNPNGFNDWDAENNEKDAHEESLVEQRFSKECVEQVFKEDNESSKFNLSLFLRRNNTGETNKEIADSLNVSEANIKKRILAIRRFLQECIEMKKSRASF
jgi:RNA polymerase sigma factor (sigma-70 family)